MQPGTWGLQVIYIKKIEVNIWEVRKVYPREKIFAGLIFNPATVHYKYRSFFYKSQEIL